MLDLLFTEVWRWGMRNLFHVQVLLFAFNAPVLACHITFHLNASGLEQIQQVRMLICAEMSRQKLSLLQWVSLEEMLGLSSIP